MSQQPEDNEYLTMEHNIQIRANNEGQNQICIPCWDEEASSSTHLNHLMEEVRIFKSKCAHLENHLEESHRQFSSLNQLYLIAQANERKLMKENEQLKKKIRQVNSESLLASKYAKQIQIDQLIQELAFYKSELENAKIKIKELEQKQRAVLNQFSEELNKGKAQIERLMGENEKLVAINENQRNELNNLKLIDQQLRSFQAKNKGLKKQLQQNVEVQEKQEQRVKELKAQKNRLEEELGQVTAQLKASKRKQNELNTCQDEIRELEGKLRTKESKIQSLQIMVENADKQLRDLRAKQKKTEERDQEKLKLERNLSVKEGDVQKLQLALKSIKQEEEELKNKIKNLEKQASSKLSQISKRDKKLENLSKQLQKWESKCEGLEMTIEEQREIISKLEKEVLKLKNGVKTSTKVDDKTENKDVENELRATIKDLEDRLKQKEQGERKQQEKQVSRRDEEEEDLEKLEGQYRKELLALKRFIDFKGSKGEEQKIEKIKIQYESKIKQVIECYHSMQQEMLFLKQHIGGNLKLLPCQMQLAQENYWEISELLKIKVEELSADRAILIDKVSVWEKKYEQIRFLLQAKLQSKEQEINLLRLKLNNMEMECDCESHNYY